MGSFKPQVYIGWDSREDEAFRTLRYSIKKHCPIADVHAIVQSELRQDGIYTRQPNLDESTEFSLTRFIIPYLMNYEGWAVFLDCDMLVTTNIMELFELADPKCAVQVVKHNYTPHQKIKMDGKKQTNYEKKNWSSVMLFNCGHEKNKNLTVEVINSVNPAFLHRFWWLDSTDTGELPVDWNFLVEWYKPFPDNILPKNIHWTLGGPWFDNYKDTDYAEIWGRYRDEMKANGDW